MLYCLQFSIWRYFRFSRSGLILSSVSVPGLFSSHLITSFLMSYSGRILVAFSYLVASSSVHVSPVAVTPRLVQITVKYQLGYHNISETVGPTQTNLLLRSLQFISYGQSRYIRFSLSLSTLVFSSLQLIPRFTLHYILLIF